MKILLADPHPQVRSALRLVLNRMPGMSVTGEASDVPQLLAQCSQVCADLILCDPELAKTSGDRPGKSRQPRMEIFNIVHRLCPGAKVVAVSSRLEIQQEALASGADGFISKTEPPEIFLAKITRL